MGDGPVHILPYDPQCHELLAIYWPCYCTIHVYVVAHFLWYNVLFMNGSKHRFCYACFTNGNNIIQEGIEIPLNSFKSATFCACLNQDLVFKFHMSWSLFLVQWFDIVDRYLCWWTISSRGYHLSSSQCYDNGILY